MCGYPWMVEGRRRRKVEGKDVRTLRDVTAAQLGLGSECEGFVVFGGNSEYVGVAVSRRLFGARNSPPGFIEMLGTLGFAKEGLGIRYQRTIGVGLAFCFGCFHGYRYRRVDEAENLRRRKRNAGTRFAGGRR